MAERVRDKSDHDREAIARTPSARMPDLTRRIQALVEAYDYAIDLDCDVWNFAVEIATLHAAGLSDSDLRWLISRVLIRHGGETTFLGEQRRSFRQIEGLRFFEQSCFVLTESGRRFAEQDANCICRPESLNRRIVERHAWQTERTPHWDSVRHELLFGDIVVKHFKLPAPNQEAILMAFEEERWATKIDDPIPPADDQEPKQRLRDTIKSLNRNQKNRLIRFTGDGSGQGVLWELIDRSQREIE